MRRASLVRPRLAVAIDSPARRGLTTSSGTIFDSRRRFAIRAVTVDTRTDSPAGARYAELAKALQHIEQEPARLDKEATMARLLHSVWDGAPADLPTCVAVRSPASHARSLPPAKSDAPLRS